MTQVHPPAEMLVFLSLDRYTILRGCIFPKGSTINDLGGGETFRQEFFFLRNCLREIIFFSRRLPKQFFFFNEASPQKNFPMGYTKNFFPYISLLKKKRAKKKALNFFFSGWGNLKYFFPGEWPREFFFLDFLRPPDH